MKTANRLRNLTVFGSAEPLAYLKYRLEPTSPGGPPRLSECEKRTRTGTGGPSEPANGPSLSSVVYSWPL
ncbi:hypothetical protein HPP92_025298 [Vanilla planifolia]|uniref:Uncharacterized protein n=1 Tax=Vanilla planifolia TaxID=51239 RepID=A0A835U7M1_VANPL|nr:hypothetical protein HPP92_025298 [Vanilla planifolia]